MAPKLDLRRYIDLLKQEDELIEIHAPVSTHLEITEIADRISKAPGKANQALLFTNVHGPDGEHYEMPVLINAMGSQRRMEIALQATYPEIQQRIKGFIK